VVPDPSPAAVSNPPNPQVPANGSLRIDITTGGPAPVNDNIDPTSTPPGQGTITPVRVDPAPQVVEVQATGAAPTASGSGITGPITGISPYGEQDDLPDVVQNTAPTVQPAQAVQTTPGITGTGITGPVDGLSPYGEQDEVVEPPPVRDPFEVDGGPGFGSAETEAGADNPNLVTLEAPDPYEIDGAGIGLTEEEIQQQDNPIAAQQQATLATARQQQVLRDQQKQANQGDWRVKLRLAPGATYLYDDPNDPGILAPLSTAAGTGGVVFPYTPQITTSYNANYNSYDLTHSNYRGYFYQNSYVGDVQVQATFTAQDSVEAEYLLAVIHFFRSVTKMFYGNNDAYAGTPPPLVFLEGLGQFQFNRHPCVVSQFNYSLPSDVDYIRARSPNVSSTNILFRRTRQDLPTNAFSSAWSRLQAAGLFPGATVGNRSGVNVPTFGTNSPTYVPTKIDIQLILLPMQTRQQVSQGFNLKEFSSGKLIQKGFW
jgi:hypothetical protein